MTVQNLQIFECIECTHNDDISLWPFQSVLELFLSLQFGRPGTNTAKRIFATMDVR